MRFTGASSRPGRWHPSVAHHETGPPAPAIGRPGQQLAPQVWTYVETPGRARAQGRSSNGAETLARGGSATVGQTGLPTGLTQGAVRRGGRILTRPGAGLSRMGTARMHERGAQTARVSNFDTARLTGARRGSKHSHGYQRREQKPPHREHGKTPSPRPTEWLGEPPGLFLHHHCAPSLPIQAIGRSGFERLRTSARSRARPS
jgi:hypothetical protein